MTIAPGLQNVVAAMSVWTVGELEPEAFWRRVCVLADDLLAHSTLRDWTIIITPGAANEAAAWGVDVDRDAREMRLTVPDGPDAPDESAPDEVATYVVLDLLHEAVLGEGGWD